MTEQQTRKPGAGREQTALIMQAMRLARVTRRWSAERLAAEMSAVGIPWNHDIVVNLERGRRESLRVHEVLAAAYVLGLDSPLDLIVPSSQSLYPVVPGVDVTSDEVRSWIRGETGPLRAYAANASMKRREVPGEPAGDHLLRQIQALIASHLKRHQGCHWPLLASVLL